MANIVHNKIASFKYQTIETYEAGIELTGPEVKSVKSGHINLKGSYVTIDPKNQIWLVGAYVSPYKPAQGEQKDYQPDRKRRLLLHRSQINSLIGKIKQKGLTIIPINVYTKRRLIKVEIALVRGKSEIDKRETIKCREISREINRSLKK